jgi:hypothetical protein
MDCSAVANPAVLVHQVVQGFFAQQRVAAATLPCSAPLRSKIVAYLAWPDSVVQRAMAPPVFDIDNGLGGLAQQAQDFGMTAGGRRVYRYSLV